MNQPKRHASNRSNARTLAVQALYNNEIGDAKQSADKLYEQITSLNESANSKPRNVDEKLLKRLLEGVLEHHAELDKRIVPLLGSNWSMDKIGPIMRSILRLAVLELYSGNNVPAKVVIKEYMRATEDFVGEKQVGFTNAILDKIAKAVRPGEFNG